MSKVVYLEFGVAGVTAINMHAESPGAWPHGPYITVDGIDTGIPTYVYDPQLYVSWTGTAWDYWAVRADLVLVGASETPHVAEWNLVTVPMMPTRTDIEAPEQGGETWFLIKYTGGATVVPDDYPTFEHPDPKPPSTTLTITGKLHDGQFVTLEKDKTDHITSSVLEGNIQFHDTDATARPVATLNSAATITVTGPDGKLITISPDREDALRKGFTLTASPTNTNDGIIFWNYDPSADGILALGETATITEHVLVEGPSGEHDETTVTITLAGALPTPEINQAEVWSAAIMDGVQKLVKAAGKIGYAAGQSTDPTEFLKVLSTTVAVVDLALVKPVFIADSLMADLAKAGTNQLAQWQAYRAAVLTFADAAFKTAFDLGAAALVSELGVAEASWALIGATAITGGYVVSSAEYAVGVALLTGVAISPVILIGGALVAAAVYAKYGPPTPIQGFKEFLSPKVQEGVDKLFRQISPPPTPTSPPDPPIPVPLHVVVIDSTTGQPMVANDVPYVGPVAGLEHEYITPTAANINISVDTDNWFIHSGAGTDAIAVHGGTNVLDGGTGSNFLVGSLAGSDTFFVDDRGPVADIWSTVVNFHAGDAATVWGVSPADFDLAWQDNQGATGYTGATLHATAAARPTASLTLVGYTQADLSNGRLAVLFGNVDGSAYMYVRANS